MYAHMGTEELRDQKKIIKQNNDAAIKNQSQAFLQRFRNLDLVSISASDLKAKIQILTKYEKLELLSQSSQEIGYESEWGDGPSSPGRPYTYTAWSYCTENRSANFEIAEIPDAQIIAQLLDAILKQAHMDEGIERYRELKSGIDTSNLNTVKAFSDFIEGSKISAEDWAQYKPLTREAVIQAVFDSLARREPSVDLLKGLTIMMPNVSIHGYVEPVLTSVKGALYPQFVNTVETTVGQLEIPVDQTALGCALDKDVVNVFVPKENREGLVADFSVAASKLHEQQTAIAVLSGYSQAGDLQNAFSNRVQTAKETLVQGILAAADSQPQENAPASLPS